MIISAYNLLEMNPDPSEDEIRRALSGNLCRCTGYIKIIESVKYAAKLKKRGAPPARGGQERGPPKASQRQPAGESPNAF